MDFAKLIPQYGFPIALATYLIWDRTRMQARRDGEILSAIEALRKTVNFLSIVVARSSGQDIEEAKKMANVDE